MILSTAGILSSSGQLPPFDFVVNTNNLSTGSSTSTQFALPIVGGAFVIDVDWGDLTPLERFTTGAASNPGIIHTYAASGTYNIKIYGRITRWAFAANTDRLKITQINQWGGFLSQDTGQFRDCSNLEVFAQDYPRITIFREFFRGCTIFNQDIGYWDMSQATSVEAMFHTCTAFNNGGSDSIGNWDVSNVDNFVSMFNGATNFNHDIGAWDMSSATNIQTMFRTASNFNNGGSDSIKNWDVSNVTNMNQVFFQAGAFNQPIGSWNVSKVTNFNQMFSAANSFNQNLGSWVFTTTSFFTLRGTFSSNTAFNNGGSNTINNWDVSNCTDMNGMFIGATAFNQPISNWDVSNVGLTDITAFAAFMQNKSSANYSARYLADIYINWSLLTLRPNLTINFATINYCNDGEAAKLSIVSTYSWSITDGNPIVCP